ncbi:MAG: sugar phosphate isomerase/epimerase family protein [Planctomycetota bacterium]|jgi:sugar phosphate isomerase/epimerase
MSHATRRNFLKTSLGAGAAALAAGPLGQSLTLAAEKPGSRMRLGLVTYLWGKDWDLSTLIANCEKAEVLGVELRTTHPHGVEPSLSAKERKEVKRRFDQSPVVFVGPGSNERFDHPDPQKLAGAIEATKAFVKLSHDCGGSGVKVKPNDLPKDVPREKTIEQIGQSLNVVAAFGADYGQEIRLEVHGKCALLPIMKEIMDVADHPNVGVCWNSNAQDLEGKGLVHNFNLVKDRFGATAHVRELNVGDYPYQQLMDMLVKMDYAGWILLECRTNPPDRVAAMIEQRKVWEDMIAAAQARALRP